MKFFSTFTPIFSRLRPWLFGLGLAAAEIDRHGDRSIALFLVAHRLCVLEDLRAVLDELLLDDRREIRIRSRKERRRRLDHREIRAELLIDGAELEPDHAAADDEEALRHVADADRLARADDLFAVELERRDLDGRAARRDHDRLRRVDRFGRALARLHSDLLRRDERRLSVEEVDAIAAEEPLHATSELLDDAVFPILHLVRVHADVVRHETDRRAVLRLLERVRRRDERLARHAAPVEAHAADLFFFDAEDFLLELPETDGAPVPAGAATDHDHVVRFVRHGFARGM
jgi:hypothetical protein